MKQFQFSVQARFSRFQESDSIDRYFYQKRNGFFVEAGSTESRTHYFERERKWSGILIEPSPSAFANLTRDGKRSSDSLAVNACLSTHKYPQKVLFDALDDRTAGKFIILTTFPNYSNFVHQNLKKNFVQ
jgi:hypothetical protein